MDWNEVSLRRREPKVHNTDPRLQIVLLSPSFPELQELQLGDNELASLSAEATPTEPLLPKLTTLNLDSNKLVNWDKLASTLLPLPSYALLNPILLSR